MNCQKLAERMVEMTDRPAKVYYIRYDEALETVVRFFFQKNVCGLQIFEVILDGTHGINCSK